MGDDLGLHLEGGNVLAAAADRVLAPVHEVEEALLVLAEAVTGMEPAVAPGLGGGFRILVVAVVHSPRAGPFARASRRPRPWGTSQSCSSTRRTSTPSRFLPQVPRFVGFGSETIGEEISVMLKIV